MTLHYQLDNKMGLLVPKLLKKSFLIVISVISGRYFKLRPLEKMLTFLGGTLRANCFRNGPWYSIPASKHTSRRMVMEFGYMTILEKGLVLYFVPAYPIISRPLA